MKNYPAFSIRVSNIAVLASFVVPALSAPGAIDGSNVGTYATPQYIVSPSAQILENASSDYCLLHSLSRPSATLILSTSFCFHTTTPLDLQLVSLAESNRFRQHQRHSSSTIRRRLLLRSRVQPNGMQRSSRGIHERILSLRSSR